MLDCSDNPSPTLERNPMHDTAIKNEGVDKIEGIDFHGYFEMDVFEMIQYLQYRIFFQLL